jgi:glycosyltransferase involved in cell wall biosynthesis
VELLILEPYYTGSHAAWADGYAEHSRHKVKILSLSGAHWKWRMHGGAVTLARKYIDQGHRPDVLLATDMLDVTTFLSLTRTHTSAIPTAIYFHENQINYPWSPKDRDRARDRDRHYGFINYVSALACNRVFFNSNYHKESFIGELPRFLEQFPDHQEPGEVDRIDKKSAVLPLGFDFSRLKRLTFVSVADTLEPQGVAARRPPLVLWNHRWEYDKNPEDFFEALKIVASCGYDFEVAVLGQSFDVIPDVFAGAREELGSRIVKYGYAEDRAEYARWLRRADILPVTSNQDFFGSSVIEAVFCDCFPLLPKRLAFPELFPAELHSACFYRDFDDLVGRLQAAIGGIDRTRKISFRTVAEKYDWENIAPLYDDALENLAGTRGH